MQLLPGIPPLGMRCACWGCVGSSRLEQQGQQLLASGRRQSRSKKLMAGKREGRATKLAIARRCASAAACGRGGGVGTWAKLTGLEMAGDAGGRCACALNFHPINKLRLAAPSMFQTARRLTPQCPRSCRAQKVR